VVCVGAAMVGVRLGKTGGVEVTVNVGGGRVAVRLAVGAPAMVCDAAGMVCVKAGSFWAAELPVPCPPPSR